MIIRLESEGRGRDKRPFLEGSTAGLGYVLCCRMIPAPASASPGEPALGGDLATGKSPGGVHVAFGRDRVFVDKFHKTA